jgi:hypothetical protein
VVRNDKYIFNFAQVLKSLKQRIYVNTQDDSFVKCVSPNYDVITLFYFPEILKHLFKFQKASQHKVQQNTKQHQLNSTATTRIQQQHPMQMKPKLQLLM